MLYHILKFEKEIGSRIRFSTKQAVVRNKKLRRHQSLIVLKEIKWVLKIIK